MHHSTSNVGSVNPLVGADPSEQSVFALPLASNRGVNSADLGLSPGHKSPQAAMARVSVSARIADAALDPSLAFVGPAMVTPPRVVIPDGGGYLQLRGGRIAADVRRSARVGTTRGRCGSFNRRVRRRLQMKVKSINRKRVLCNPKMLTLTYPSTWSLSSDDWKRDLANFEKRLRRKYSRAAGIWVLEFQERGAPHYHLLIYNVPFVCRDWLARAWYEVVASGDANHLSAGTRVENIRRWDRASAYIGKYASKNEQKLLGGILPEHVGRWWGVFNKRDLPVDECVQAVSFPDFYLVRRILARYINAAMRQDAVARGRNPRRRRYRGSVFSGLTAYMDCETAFKLMRYLGYSPVQLSQVVL
jgi:hypothetical protein